MRPADVAAHALGSLRGARLRAVLTLLAMAIGVAAVIVLTALGEGARRFVVGEFAALGTNLIIVLPGRAETVGTAPPLLGEIPRDLTLDDAIALARSPAIRRIAPLALGAAPVARGGFEREVMILGSTAEMLELQHLELRSGKFLPPTAPDVPSPVAVLGATVADELFGGESPLGQWIRVGERRFRVVGVLASRGRSIGFDLHDVVVVPVASAQALFNSFSLFRVGVEATSRESIPRAVRAIRETIRRRHDGEDDVTVITQDAVLSTFDTILRALTLAVGGIAAISLIVAGVLVMNVMLVSVAERTDEIGLLKALGAPPRQILALFLAEAAALALAGALVGVVVGELGARAIERAYPLLPVRPPAWAVPAAVATALGAGLLFGILPARRAARLDPLRALTHDR